MVSQKEIIEALRISNSEQGWEWRNKLANRIEAEGIAPPDGHIIVPTCAVRKKPYVPMTDKEWREYFDDDMSGLSYNFYREIEAHIIKSAGLEIKHD